MRKLAFSIAVLPYRPLILNLPFKLVLRVLLLTTILANTLLAFPQNAPHPSFHQYTTDEGLASSETFYILQDPVGFIWISTDNGVSQYDGYEFRNYGLKDGLVENVIFMMQLDTLGRLWMQAMSGNLYYLEGQRIHPYWYNQALQNFKDRPDTGKGFIVEGAGETVHIATLKYGLITIFKNGETSTFSHDEPLYNQLFEKDGKAIFSIFNNSEPAALHAYQNSLIAQHQSLPIYFYTNGAQWSISGLDYSFDRYYTPEAFSLGHEKYLFQMFHDLWLIENKTVTSKLRYPANILYARIMNGGQLLIGLYRHQGLSVYNSIEAFRKNQGNVWLPGQSVNYFMEDREGGRWFATHEDGVFYAPADAFMVYDLESGLPDRKITALAFKNRKELFVGLENGEVWALHTETGKWKKMPDIPGSGAISDLYLDGETQQLWVGRDQLFFLHKNQWKHLTTAHREVPFAVANRITKSQSGKRLWLSNYRGFMSLEVPNKRTTNLWYGRDQRTCAIVEDFSGHVWVGQPNGLFEWKNGTLHKRQSLHPAFSLRVEDIAILPDSTVVIATKGGGIVFWKDKTFEQITTENGLTADMLECLYTDDKGVVWAGTLNGLNRISGAWGDREVERITVFNGLPSNEINRVRTMGEHVWVATSKGLVHFSHKGKNQFSPKPIIASVLANNKPVDLHAPTLNLHANENNLSIRFFAINYKMNGKIKYRYRINGSNWEQTTSRSLNFPALPPAKTFFEVQAQNEDGIWSESTTLQLVIYPPWYNTIWAKTALVLILLLTGWLVYFFRNKQLKRTHQIQLQIAELERSALQAQMNPHFIFNCLNSIQRFILQNEKEPAIMYLGNFAGLVRSILNASVAGKILLTEEISLLNNYLALESLRFKNRFSYDVKVADDVDIFEIEIPPLLVQPYVENAVLHGISGRASGGKVSVLFEKKEDCLQVIIRDNGNGMTIKVSDAEKSRFHKSFGMSITSRRLDLLFNLKETDAVATRKLFTPNGQAAGTEVKIKIRLQNILLDMTNPDSLKV